MNTMKTAKPSALPEAWKFSFSIACAVAVLTAFVVLLHH